MAKNNKARTLWNQDFQIVKHGLDEKQVTEFVDELMAKLKQAEERSYPSSLDRLAEQTVVEAEKLAEKLKDEAKQIRMQAQAEADRIVAEAQATAQEQAESISKVAKVAAEEAQKVVHAAREKAALIEVEGRRKAEQLLDFTKRRIENQIRRDVKGASERLLRYMDDIEKEVQALGIDLQHWEVRLPEAVETRRPPPLAEAEEIAVPAEHDAADTALHEGPLQVVVQAPVSSMGLGEIFGRLMKLEDVTLRDTHKTDDGSHIISLSLEHPVPLLSILKHSGNVAEVVVEQPGIGEERGGGAEEAEAIEGATRPLETRILVKLKV